MSDISADLTGITCKTRYSNATDHWFCDTHSRNAEEGYCADGLFELLAARRASDVNESTNEVKAWEKVEKMRQYLMFELDSFDLDSNGHKGWVASFDDGARTWCGHGRSRMDAIEKAIAETEKGLAALAHHAAQPAAHETEVEQ